MANYEETIKTPSQNIVSGQNGRLFIDEAQGRMIMFDGSTNRMILGQLPDGSVNIIFVKEGVNAFDVFD